MPSGNEQNKNKAFDELFQEYFKPLCAYCQYKFGLDIDMAKDAVHSAFTKLLESDFTFCSKLSSKTYLYKVVTNICLDLKRHEKIKEKHVEFFQKQVTNTKMGNGNTIAELKELQNDINKAIAELPEQMRKVFELSRHDGLKYAEIARQLGISIKTVEIQMTRALVKLRKKLASYLSIYWLFLVTYGWYNKYFF